MKLRKFAAPSSAAQWWRLRSWSPATAHPIDTAAAARAAPAAAGGRHRRRRRGRRRRQRRRSGDLRRRGDAEVVRRLRLLADGHAEPRWSIFDFAVVVANTGTTDATSRSPGPNGVEQDRHRRAGQLQKIYLPWVARARRAATTAAARPSALDGVGARRRRRVPPRQLGAGHRLPVQRARVQSRTAARRARTGALPDAATPCSERQLGCFSFSNDASLLLPSTAMTGNYRVTGSARRELGMQPRRRSSSVTGTADDTTVTVKLVADGNVVAGGGVAAIAGGADRHVHAQRRATCAELVAAASVSGDSIRGLARQGRQAGAGHRRRPLRQHPVGARRLRPHRGVGVPRRDARQALLRHARRPGRDGSAVGHTVRLYRQRRRHQPHVQPRASPGAPATLNAGQVVDIGADRRPTSRSPAITSSPSRRCMLGGSVVDPSTPVDACSAAIRRRASFFAVEQYRTNYLFLAPTTTTSATSTSPRR